jgi:hypothetical protein
VWDDVPDKRLIYITTALNVESLTFFPLGEEKSNGMTLGIVYLPSVVGLFAVP